MFVQSVYSEKAGHESYKSHLKDIKEWDKGKPVVTGNIRMKLFERALYVACVLFDMYSDDYLQP